MNTPKDARNIASSLEYAIKVLKAPRISHCYEQLALHAQDNNWTFERYLLAVLEQEAHAREASGAQLRIKRAGFPTIKTIAEFNFTHQPSIDRALIARLETSAWITSHDNIVLLGPPGTGKTHLATALGITAARQGYRVLFDTTTGWINRLQHAHQIGQLPKLITKLARYDLLIIDEIGYLPIEADAANLFFQLIAQRYEQGSLIITSNLPFSAWAQCFGEATIAAAIIDRIIHHAHIITHEGESYRLNNHTTGHTNK